LAAGLSLLLGAALGAFAQGPGAPAPGTPGAPGMPGSPVTPAPVTPQAAVSSETIRSVTVETTNVFDPSVPGEDWWPFRIANRIHQRTRKEVVRRELLLDVGDNYDRLKALESERNLRGLGIFRRADVKAVPRKDGGSDLIARTQDSWTTNILLGAGT
jgi:outer membrane protein assembly factor BamA